MSEVVWVTGTVLQALAVAGAVAGNEFSATQLQGWLAGALTDSQRTNATSRLVKLGFLRHRVGLIKEGGHDLRADLYLITPEGAEAVRAAAAGALRKSGPKGPRRAVPARADTFVGRLWALLRIRRKLDSETAARMLVDAGDDAKFARARATAAKTFKRWADAGAVAESAQRVRGADQPISSNGLKAWVLLEDAPHPPHWHKAKASADRASKGCQ